MTKLIVILFDGTDEPYQFTHTSVDDPGTIVKSINKENGCFAASDTGTIVWIPLHSIGYIAFHKVTDK